MLRHCPILMAIALTVLAFTACQADTARGDLAEKVTSFDQYPIVWLGASYDADGDGVSDPITSARTDLSPALHHPLTGQLVKPAQRWFTISYGMCEIPDGASACPIPLQLNFSAPCENRGVPEVSRTRTVSLHGVDAIVDSNGHVRFETADFTLTVSAIGSSNDEQAEKALRIARDLVPANAMATSRLLGGNFRPKPADLRARPTP